MLSNYWKAGVAFVAPGAALMIAAVTPGSDGGSSVTLAELVTAAATCVVTSAAVYKAPRNVATREWED